MASESSVLDEAVCEAAHEAAMGQVSKIYNAVLSYDYLGIPPAQVTRDVLDGKVSLQLYNHWRNRSRDIPEKYHKKLYNGAARGVVVAHDVIADIAKKHPEAVPTIGFANYCRRVMLAKELMLELEIDMKKRAGEQTDGNQAG